MSLWNSNPGQETECTAKIDNISCLYIGLKKQNTASTERRSTPSNQESVYRLITSNTRIILKQRWGDSLNPYMTIFPKEIYALWLQLWCISRRQSWEMFAYFLAMKAYMIEAYCHSPRLDFGIMAVTSLVFGARADRIWTRRWRYRGDIQSITKDTPL